MQMQSYKEEVSKEQQYKPRLYSYPDFKQSSTVFDEDDLTQENALFVLCVRASPEEAEEDTVHVWKGYEFESSSLSEEVFIENVVQAYFGAGVKSSQLRIVQEEPGEESDEFLNYFD